MCFWNCICIGCWDSLFDLQELGVSPQQSLHLLNLYDQMMAISAAQPETVEALFFSARYKNDAVACSTLTGAANRKDPLAAAYASCLHHKVCNKLPQDQERAVEYANIAMPWLRSEAAKGKKYAQCHLGLCYADGRGAEQDNVQAIKCFQLAAAQGHCIAQNKLGMHTTYSAVLFSFLLLYVRLIFIEFKFIIELNLNC